VGGVIRWLVERRAQAGQQSLAEVESGPGVLFSSGLIAGGAIAGIVVAAIAGATGSAEWLAHATGWSQALGPLATASVLSFVLFALLGGVLYKVAARPS